MRPAALRLLLAAASACAVTAQADTADSPIAVRVNFVGVERGSCKSSGADGRVTCESQPLGLTTLDRSQQWSSPQTARLGSGSDAYWKVGDGAGSAGGEGPYGAYATSRVVTYGGIQFVELTLNW